MEKEKEKEKKKVKTHYEVAIINRHKATFLSVKEGGKKNLSPLNFYFRENDNTYLVTMFVRVYLLLYNIIKNNQ